MTWTENRERTGGEGRPVLALLAVLLLLGVLGLAVAVAPQVRYPIPFSDVWHYLGRDDALLDPAELMAPHNEHLVATTKLALWLDEVLDRGRQRVAWGINLGLVAAVLALLAWSLRRQPGREQVAAAAVLAAGLAGVNAALTAAFPFFLGHLLFMPLALGAALLLRPAALAGRSPGRQAWRLAGALGLMLLAQISLASGAAVGLAPGLLLLLAPAPLPPRRGRVLGIATLLATLVAWGALYGPSAGLTRPAAPLPEILLYGLQLLGSPFAMPFGLGATGIAAWAGLGVLLLLAATAWQVLRRPSLLRGPLGWGAAALLLTCAASLAGVARARAGSGWGPLDPKYLHYACTLLGAALALWLLRRPPPRRRLAALLPPLAILLLPALNAVALPTYVGLYRVAMLDLRSFTPGLALLVADPRLMHGAPPDVQQARLLALRARGLAVFAEPDVDLIGRPLAQVAPRLEADCAGSVSATERFPLLDPQRPRATGLRVTAGTAAGWQPRLLLFAAADGGGPVLGYALALRADRRAEALAFGTTWRGYLAVEPGSGEAAGWLFDPAAGRRCRAFLLPLP